MSRTVISRSECFEVLGIQEGASEDEIRRAYKKLALKHHPDKNNNSEESTAKFKEISTAYQKLTKPDFDDDDGDFEFTDMNEMFMQVLMARLFGMNPFMRGGPGPVFINPGGFGGGGFGGGGFHFHDFDDDEDDYYDEDDDDDEHHYFHDHPFFHYRPGTHYHDDDDEDEYDEEEDDEEGPSGMDEEARRRFWQARMRAYYEDDDDEEGGEYDEDDDEAEEDLDADEDDSLDPEKIGDERYKHTFKYNPHPMAAAIRDSEYGVFTDLLEDHPEYATANLGVGNTAMHFCARFGRVRFANHLCEHGGLQTIALRNEKEESPIEIAEAYAHKSVGAFREIAARARKQARKDEQESKAKQQQPAKKKNNKKNKKYKNTQKGSDKKKQENGANPNTASNGNNGKAAEKSEKKEQEESDEEEDVSFGQNVFSVLQGASKK